MTGSNFKIGDKVRMITDGQPSGPVLVVDGICRAPQPDYWFPCFAYTIRNSSRIIAEEYLCRAKEGTWDQERI